MTIHEHNNIPRSFTEAQKPRFYQPQVHIAPD